LDGRDASFSSTAVFMLALLRKYEL